MYIHVTFRNTPLWENAESSKYEMTSVCSKILSPQALFRVIMDTKKSGHALLKLVTKVKEFQFFQRGDLQEYLLICEYFFLMK